MTKAYLFLLIAIISEVIATTMLKKSDGFTRLLPSVFCTVGYAVAFYFLSMSLRTLNVGVAYGIWCGLGIVLISLLAFFFFHEKLDLAAMLGLGMIIGGVVVIQVFSRTVSH
jgi:small multidrug resistance pump